MKTRHAAALGKKGGKVGGLSKSPAKTAAARENGKKGGRPRKPVSDMPNAEMSQPPEAPRIP